MNEPFTQELSKLIQARIEEIKSGHGLIRRLVGWIGGLFLKGPRAEIAHDWLVVNEFAGRAKQRLISGSADAAGIDPDLVSVYAYLSCAREERDFAQAWTYVNLAAALLPLVVVEQELNACTTELRSQDRRLPAEFRKLLEETVEGGSERIGRAVVDLLQDPGGRAAAVGILTRIGPAASWAVPALKKLLEGENKELHNQVAEALIKIGTPAAAEPAPDSVPPPASDQTGLRYRLCGEQLARALMWNMVNRRVSLKISLWRSLGRRLATALVAPILAAMLWVACASPGPKPAGAETVPNVFPQGEAWPVVQFLAIALLGFFGGTLSAFLKARETVVNIPSYEAIKTHTSLRMLLGAAGALVVYVVGLWLFAQPLKDLIQQNLFVFMSLGIAAGFSERLFIDALEKAALNLHLTGTTKKIDEHEEETSDPAAAKGRRS